MILILKYFGMLIINSEKAIIFYIIYCNFDNS
jgi:hypothetical protein